MWLVLPCLLLLVSPARPQSFREDGLCGAGHLAPNGKIADCQHIPPFTTCCQKNGHCGWECGDAPPPSGGGGDVGRPSEISPPPSGGGGDVGRPAEISPPATTAAPVFTTNGTYRSDGRCGATNPLEDGSPTECDPNSEYWCCSEHGFCGGSQEHCYCATCVNYRPVEAVGKVRSDRRCGPDFSLEDGSPGECDGFSANPCCSSHGYCGPGPEHCDCPGCVDYRGGEAKEVPLLVGKVRTDRRCGSGFPLEDGSPSECDGSSANPCCSKWGFCGLGDEHCACPTCVDNRTEADKSKDWEGRWRKDRRCGSAFLLPDGTGPAECNPAGENHCCSKWGFCGGDGEHCDCADCVNYTKEMK